MLAIQQNTSPLLATIFGLLMFCTFPSAAATFSSSYTAGNTDYANVTVRDLGKNTRWSCRMGSPPYLELKGYVDLRDRNSTIPSYHWFYVILRSDDLTIPGGCGLDGIKEFTDEMDKNPSKLYNFRETSRVQVRSPNEFGRGSLTYNNLFTDAGFFSGPFVMAMPTLACRVNDLTIDFQMFRPGKDSPVGKNNLAINCNYSSSVTLSMTNDTVVFSGAEDSEFKAVLAPQRGTFPLRINATENTSVPLQATLQARCADFSCVPAKAYSGSTVLILNYN